MSVFAGLIGVLGCLFLGMGILGGIAPSIFRDKKTGVVPKRVELLVGGVVGAAIAFGAASWLSPDKGAVTIAESSKQTAEVKTEVVNTLPQEQPAKAKLDSANPPSRFTVARAFAENSLSIMLRAEDALESSIKKDDRRYLHNDVRRPLQNELTKWPTILGSSDDDPRMQFAYCRQAITELLSISQSLPSENSTAQFREYQEMAKLSYAKSRDKCKKQILASDEEITAAIAHHEAELKRKFGGRECLTVLTVDKYTGRVEPMPKPAHCKS